MKSEKKGRLATDHGFITVKGDGYRTQVEFKAPRHENDRKRLGTDLVIRKGHKSIHLDGHAIKSLRAVLEKADSKIWESVMY